MMNYPPFSDYDRAVKQAADHFNVLSHLRPVLDEQGELVYCKGSLSVVFKMHDEQNGKDVAVKCFLNVQEGHDESYRLIVQELSGVQSDYLVPVRYLEQELTVTTEEGEEETYPVVVMDWVEGVQLHQYVEAHLFEKYPLQMLAYRFSCLASWLMDQPFAHADLCPEHILVRPDGSLVLVDYDAMYVPAMKGQEPREHGHDDYYFFITESGRFDERIDDFALVTILLSLKAVSLRSLLWKEFVVKRRNAFYDDDVLLFTDDDYYCLGRSPLFAKLQDLFSDTELARLCGLFFMAHADGDLAKASSECVKLELPRQMAVEEMTEVTDDDMFLAVTDEYGVAYSPDGLRLLKGAKGLKGYTVREGTRVICKNAFKNCKSLQSLDLPAGLTSIGDVAFRGCRSLKSLDLPAGLTSIGDSAFSGCRSLQSLDLPAGLTSIGDSAFSGCRLLQSLDLPSGLKSIGHSAFSGCRSLQSLDFPAGLKSIGFFAFSGCCSLQSLDLPAGLKSIGCFAFSDCHSLQSVTLPAGLTSIDCAAFEDCHSLQSVTLPAGLTSIDCAVFEDCHSLQSVTLPSGLTSIGDSAFSGCLALQSLTLPAALTSLGKGAFARCKQLLLCSKSHHFKMVDNMFLISDDMRLLFYKEKGHTVCVPEGVKTIEDAVFAGHHSLERVTLPSSLKRIGDRAFEDCRSLQCVRLPTGLKSIGLSVFHNCPSLRHLAISAKDISHFKAILPSEYHSLLKVQSKPQSLRNDVDADDALEAQT